jgi:PAS domain S-box-containing protein
MRDVHAFVGKVIAAALAEGEERFRALADQAPFAIWAVDPAGNVLFVNLAYREFYGLSEAEALGAGWRVRLHPEDVGPCVDELRTALRERRDFVQEARVRHASGEWRWVESHAVPRFSDSGEMLGMVGSSSDITARKQREEALRASEEKYRSLFESMAEEVHFWALVRDEAGEIETWRLVDANPPTLESWGRTSLDEVRGKTTDEIFGPGATEHYLPVVRRIFSEGVSHTYEDYFPHLDKYFRFTSVPVGEYFITTGADITAVRKANEALRVSEERFRVLFEGHGAAMLLIEPDSGRILAANEAAARFYGYPREQLQAMTIQQINLLPPEEVAAERRRAAGRSKSVFVFPHLLANGEVRFVEVYSSSVTIQGRPTLFSIIHDVTERRRAEEALERTRSMLAEAQRIAHLGSFEYIAATRTTVWSEEESRIYGLDPAGPSPEYEDMLAECIHPDDAALLHETFTEALSSASVYELEHRIVRPDGSVRWVYDRAYPYLGEDGDLLRYMGATLDITERKEAEEALRMAHERLRRFVDADIVGVVIADAAGGVVETNDYYLRLIGFTRDEFEQGKVDWRAITPPEWRAVDERALAELRAAGTCTPFEKEYLRRDGTRVSVLIADAVLPGPQEEIASFVLDITERKRTEEALRESEAERTAQQERARLARDLHDSVSQAIFAAALEAEALDLAAECGDVRIGPSAKQVCRLCRGAQADLRAMLLELRGERLEDIPMDQLLRQLVEATEGRTSAGIELAVRGSSVLPPDVRLAFYRVAQEALNNVARHAKAQNARVEVELSGAGGSLQVRDDGRGFEPRDFGSEHFGIRSMRERAAEVGADLDVTSAAGQGTCVTLRWRGSPAADD